MNTITDYIHEIFVVLMFAGAITFLVFLTNTSQDIGQAVDSSSRNKTNVVEGLSEVTIVEVDGSTVYYDIKNMIDTVEPVKIVIVDQSGNQHTVRPNHSSDVIVKEFGKSNISTTLKGWLKMGDAYIKTYADDYDATTGQAKMITTIKYTHK